MSDEPAPRSGPTLPPPVETQPQPPAPDERLLLAYASLTRRGWAFVLDVIFLWLVASVLVLPVPAAADGAAVVLLVGIYVTWTATLGGSVGKRLLGLRVARDEDGTLLGWGAAFVREVLVRPISLLALGAGVLWMLDHPRRQTWHDMAASSVVVHEHREHVAPAWAARRA